MIELLPPALGNVEEAPASVLVDPGVRYQEIEGCCGAFTEAAAHTFYRLPPERRTEVLKAYFDPVEGLGYTLCRTILKVVTSLWAATLTTRWTATSSCGTSRLRAIAGH